jgi:hypothetical protein
LETLIEGGRQSKMTQKQGGGGVSKQEIGEKCHFLYYISL